MRILTTILQSWSVKRHTPSVYGTASDDFLPAILTLKYALQSVKHVLINALLMLQGRIVTRLIAVTSSMTPVVTSATNYFPRKDQNHPKTSEEGIMR